MSPADIARGTCQPSRNAIALGAQIGAHPPSAGATGRPPFHGSDGARLSSRVRELHAGDRAVLFDESEDPRQRLDVRVGIDPEIRRR